MTNKTCYFLLHFVPKEHTLNNPIQGAAGRSVGLRKYDIANRSAGVTSNVD